MKKFKYSLTTYNLEHTIFASEDTLFSDMVSDSIKLINNYFDNACYLKSNSTVTFINKKFKKSRNTYVRYYVYI